MRQPYPGATEFAGLAQTSEVDSGISPWLLVAVILAMMAVGAAAAWVTWRRGRDHLDPRVPPEPHAADPAADDPAVVPGEDATTASPVGGFVPEAAVTSEPDGEGAHQAPPGTGVDDELDPDSRKSP